MNVIIKLVVDGEDNDDSMLNSVMTFFRVRQKNLKKLEKHNKVLYKRE